MSGWLAEVNKNQFTSSKISLLLCYFCWAAWKCEVGDSERRSSPEKEYPKIKIVVSRIPPH